MFTYCHVTRDVSCDVLGTGESWASRRNGAGNEVRT